MRGALPRVYLAGPITGLSYDGATDWRQYATSKLLPEVIGVSPMRAKEFLKGMKLIGGTAREKYMADNVVSSGPGIMTRDRWDVRTTDAVLMNLLGATQVSIGTMIEAGWADAYRQPLVVVRGPTDKLHEHVMLDQAAGYIVSTLEEGIDIIRALFI